MKLRDRKEKKLRRQTHMVLQTQRKRKAIEASVLKSGKISGKRMEKQGYLPNGKGGWRRMTATEKERYEYAD